MIRTIETMIYTISSHPDKEKCYEWIRGNWHDLNQHSVDDLIQSIEELSKVIGGTCNYDTSKVLHNFHDDTEATYSDEGLYDLCECSGYEFDEDGIFV